MKVHHVLAHDVVRASDRSRRRTRRAAALDVADVGVHRRDARAARVQHQRDAGGAKAQAVAGQRRRPSRAQLAVDVGEVDARPSRRARRRRARAIGRRRRRRAATRPRGTCRRRPAPAPRRSRPAASGSRLAAASPRPVSRSWPAPPSRRSVMRHGCAGRGRSIASFSADVAELRVALADLLVEVQRLAGDRSGARTSSRDSSRAASSPPR